MIKSHSSPPSAADRRALVVGGAAVSCILLAGRAVPAWRAWTTGAQAGALELRAEQAQASATIRRLPAVRDSARARAERARVAAAALLHVPSAAAATGALAERAAAVATTADVHLGALSLDVVDPRGCAVARAGATPPGPQRSPDVAQRGGVPVTPCVRRVRLRTEITGDLHGIAVFLTLLERGGVPVTVPHLALTQADPAAPPTRAEALRGTITLEALAIADATVADSVGAGVPSVVAPPRASDPRPVRPP